MDESRQITTIIKDHVEGLAIREGIKGLLNTPSVLLLGLSFPSENWDACSSNSLGARVRKLHDENSFENLRRRRVILSRVDVLLDHLD